MGRPVQMAGMPGRGQISLGARCVLLAAISIALMIADHRNNHLQRVRDALSLVALPFQLAVDAPFSAWDSMSRSLTERRELLTENQRLKAELRSSQVRLQTLESLKEENKRLREYLNSLDAQPDAEIGIAEILSVDFDNRSQFVINRGRADRVYVGQPLLDAEGVVGQVKSVSEWSAEALLITDASHRVHVSVRRSGYRNIAVGTGDSGMLRLPWVANNADINVGDVLVTSGLGRVFPRNRPVAVVTKVMRRPEQEYAEVEARPIAALDRGQEVLLIWNDSPSAPDADGSSPGEPAE